MKVFEDKLFDRHIIHQLKGTIYIYIMRAFTTWCWPRIKKDIYYYSLKEMGIWIDAIT